MKKEKNAIKRLPNLIKAILILGLFIMMSNTHSVFAQNWNQIIKTVASDRWSDDLFGYSVAISGEYAIVGAYYNEEDTIGGNTLDYAGSAYIFKNDGGTWSEVQKIVASDRGAGDNFGWSVAISGDYAIVGAINNDFMTSAGFIRRNAGSAYIFKNNAGIWTETQKLVASDRGADDYFGFSVAISGDYAIVGASREDQGATGGNTLDDAGSAYIFKNNAGTWGQVQKIVASDREAGDEFGRSVAISGEYAIIGAPREDLATYQGYDAGSAYIFKNNAGTWGQIQKIGASDREAGDGFGRSVAISGDYAIIGAPEDDLVSNQGSDAGSAYIFNNNSGTWSQVQKIVASDRGAADRFGHSVAISGDYVIVGSPGENHDATGSYRMDNAGSAYVFRNNAGTWSQLEKIVASDRGAGDNFGWSVAISGDYAFVGATGEDHDVAGENTLNDAGSAYVFKTCLTSGIDEQTACDTFTWINGNTYTSSTNTVVYTLTNAAGCDSVVTLNLTINSNTGRDVQSACSSFTWIDGNTYTSTNNTAKHILTNAAGCDSVVTLDLTINSNIGTDVQTACGSYKWIDGNTYKTNNNTATYTLTNAAGCDSVVTLNLTINNFTDATTSTSGPTIIATNGNASYQWLDCDSNYLVIEGETNQGFTPSVNGNYAVEITENECVDTSDCVSITTAAIVENSFENSIIVYPNPSDGEISIDLGINYNDVSVCVRNQLSQEVLKTSYSDSNILQFNIPGEAGVYYIEVMSDERKAVVRVVKE